MTGIIRKKIEYLYLIPIFFCYISLANFSFQTNTYIQFIVYPLIILLLRKNEAVLAIFASIALIIFNLSKEICYNNMEPIIQTLKILLYIICIYIVYKNSTFEKIFEAIYALSKIAVVILISTYVIGLISEIHLLANFGYSQIRYHAFFTEPSSVAIPFSILASICIIKRQYIWLLATIFATIVSLSIIAQSLVLFSLILTLLCKLTNHRFTTLIFVTVVVVFVLLFDISMLQPIEQINERFYSGLRSIFTFGEHGYNPRVITTIAVIDQLHYNNSFYTGLGLEINNCLSQNFIWSYDSNIHIYIFRSFGIIGITIFWLANLIIISFLHKSDNYFRYIMVVITLAGVTINGAQGLLYFTLFILTLALSTKREKR